QDNSYGAVVDNNWFSADGSVAPTYFVDLILGHGNSVTNNNFNGGTSPGTSSVDDAIVLHDEALDTIASNTFLGIHLVFQSRIRTRGSDRRLHSPRSAKRRSSPSGARLPIPRPSSDDGTVRAGIQLLHRGRVHAGRCPRARDEELGAGFREARALRAAGH